MPPTQQGFCCVCQEIVTLYYGGTHGLSDSDIEDHEHGMLDESFMFRCSSHDFYGQHCDGSGQVPQFLVEKPTETK